MTRPHGDLGLNPNWIDRYLLAPSLVRIDRALAEHYLMQSARYRQEIQGILGRATQDLAPRAWVIQIPGAEIALHPLETSRPTLIAGVRAGFNAVYSAFGLPAPTFEET
jgi:hypothetical protein